MKKNLKEKSTAGKLIRVSYQVGETSRFQVTPFKNPFLFLADLLFDLFT
jgi:hypothetical protein